MKLRSRVKATPEPPLPPGLPSSGAPAETEQPESNATRQLEKPRVRRKARADQAILQEKGPDALPVSDYPQKEGPVAANTIDQQERERSGNSRS